jgi:hypothetical protein
MELFWVGAFLLPVGARIFNLKEPKEHRNQKLGPGPGKRNPEGCWTLAGEQAQAQPRFRQPI